jgi:hypothetical protein
MFIMMYLSIVEEILDEAEHFLGLGILRSTYILRLLGLSARRYKEHYPCLYHDGRHCDWSVDTAALQCASASTTSGNDSLWTVNVG